MKVSFEIGTLPIKLYPGDIETFTATGLKSRHFFIHQEFGETWTVRDVETGERVAIGGIAFMCLTKHQVMDIVRLLEAHVTDGSSIAAACQSMTRAWGSLPDMDLDWGEWSGELREAYRELQLRGDSFVEWLEKRYGVRVGVEG